MQIEWMTITEAAKAAGRTANLVYNNIYSGKISPELVRRKQRGTLIHRDALPIINTLQKRKYTKPYKPKIYVYMPDPDGDNLGLILPVDSVKRYLKVRAAMRAAGRTKNHWMRLKQIVNNTE